MDWRFGLTEELYAISVRQPWAWAIIYGGKDVENRNRAPDGTTALLGRRVWVHAAKGMTQEEYEGAECFMSALGVACPRPDALTRGAVIGSVEITDLVSERPSRWFMGPRGIVLSHPKACTPAPAIGQLGWFHPTYTGEIAPAKPWMKAWPKSWRPKRAAAAPVEQPEAGTGDLFVEPSP